MSKLTNVEILTSKAGKSYGKAYIDGMSYLAFYPIVNTLKGIPVGSEVSFSCKDSDDGKAKILTKLVVGGGGIPENSAGHTVQTAVSGNDGHNTDRGPFSMYIRYAVDTIKDMPRTTTLDAATFKKEVKEFTKALVEVESELIAEATNPT